MREEGLGSPTLLREKALPRDLIHPLLRNGLIRFSDCFFSLCFVLSIAYALSLDVEFCRFFSKCFCSALIEAC